MSKKLKQVEKDLQQLKNQSEKVEQELKELSPKELEKIAGGGYVTIFGQKYGKVTVNEEGKEPAKTQHGISWVASWTEYDK